MSIFSTIMREIERIGENVTVTTEAGSFRAKGILTPLLYKNKMYLAGTQLPEGFCDGGHYLLIMPAYVKIPVLGTAMFQCGDDRYVLKRSERVQVDSHGVYVWAVVTPYVVTMEDERDET